MKTIHACESTTMSWLFPGKKWKKYIPENITKMEAAGRWPHCPSSNLLVLRRWSLPWRPIAYSTGIHKRGRGEVSPGLKLLFCISAVKDWRLRFVVIHVLDYVSNIKKYIYIYVNLTNVSLNISYGLKRLLRKIFGKKKKMAKGHTKLYWYAILKPGFCAASTHPIGYWKWYAYWTCQKNSAVSFTPQTPQKVPCKGFHQKKKDEKIKIKIFPEIPRKKNPFQNQNPKNKHHLEHLLEKNQIFPGWFIKLSQPTPPPSQPLFSIYWL